MRYVAFAKLVAVSSFAGLLTLSGYAPDADAKSKKKEPEPVACPVDTAIRTADPALLRRFGLLEGCAAQIAVMPATPDEYLDPNVVMINADEIEQNYGQPPAQAPGSNFAGSKKRGKKDEPFSMFSYTNVNHADKGQFYYVEDAVQADFDDYAQMPLSGNGVAVSVRPSAREIAVDARLLSSGAMDGQYGLGAAADYGDYSNAAGSLDILGMEPRSYRTIHDNLITRTAQKHRIDPLLLHAVIKQESGYKSGAVSHAGARGLMQIMPATGRSLGVAPSNLHNAEVNVDAGARLLRKLWFKYGGNVDLMLAAYNAGEGAVAKFGNKIPPYRETQNYVKVIKAHYYKLLAEQTAGQAQQ
ncbi:lytic transglycosylase domain-containing protein [Sphingorhabdus arenilitoris]|uniref:Lytic transglycosylase domain-containing protein n=1 Tax=Sphingorhabdus arenilitoris TaxID=1490041 RepID=A0ABV8RI64_9SPHN